MKTGKKSFEQTTEQNLTSIIALLDVLCKKVLEQEIMLNEIKIILLSRNHHDEEQNSFNAMDLLNQSNGNENAGDDQESEDLLADQNNNDENTSENPNEILCCDCMKTFKRGRGEFTRHIKDTPCKPYQCLDCGKLFKKKSNMASHQLTHSKEVFPCDQCEATFKCRKYLNNHISRKHLKVDSMEHPEVATSLTDIQSQIKREHSAEINDFGPSPKKVRFDEVPIDTPSTSNEFVIDTWNDEENN